MKIYHHAKLVSMQAEMEIKSDTSAETDFVDAPLQKGMKKALEMYAVKKIAVGSQKCLMEFGL
jgi:hypothetical protein